MSAAGAAHAGASLRRVILTRWSLLVLAAMLLLILAYVLVGLRPIMTRIAEEQFNLAALHARYDLDALFQPAPQQLRMALDRLHGEAPPVDTPDAFNALFMPVSRALPQISSVVAGTNTGEAWMLLAQPGGAWRNRLTDLRRWGMRHKFVDHAPDGATRTTWQNFDYDARARPWYRQAVAAGQPGAIHWTAP